jgi:hypothetical protein
MAACYGGLRHEWGPWTKVYAGPLAGETLAACSRCGTLRKWPKPRPKKGSR